ncbi:cation efflux family protein family [Myriangium duriaei CBS 260.36]|uniref:Zinc transporter n=1 Tax=Myriangium duriaei CBS 260.36 TaxID=1168546 RepID=A0A9P4J6H3_9PEZI|nr:cation efflux family protein family [Myriangium duriaei CBS 260.36]
MAANTMPIPVPPRTPSPTSPYDGDSDVGLGIDLSPSKRQQAAFTFDLSPSEPMAPRPAVNANMLSPEFTPVISPTKTMETTIDSPMTPFSATARPDENTIAAENPFNFTTQQYTANRPVAARADLGRRKGHKYKHSSISHQIFQAPAPRPALQLPTVLPMPTRAEVRSSMTGEQKSRLAWCLCHFAVAAYVQWSARGSLAMTALSRLLFFDASGAVICVFVDLMGNFEVWKRSSLRHPFGLERADVLAGFGLAVFIAFMGLDVLSHGIEHSLENQGGHVPHTNHGHGRVSPGSVDLAALLAIVSTIVSAVLLKNHARIGKAMRFELIAGWGKILGNPSHFMTLSCSTLLLLLPLMSIQTYTWFDTALSGIIALLMVAFGARLGMSLASMLLMSYSGPGGVQGVKEVIAEIEADPLVSEVEEARFWQVHYGVGMANLKLRYKGSGYGDELSKMREKLARLIRNRLGGEYGSGGLKWEVSTQLILEGN